MPRLLDLFSGEGGAAMGYLRAGWDVTGVDSRHACARRYPGTFVEGDALAYVNEYGADFDAIHASPPCQPFSITRHTYRGPPRHPDLLEPTRQALQGTGRPYVIENVPGAPLRMPLLLCGASFGLTATDDDGTPLVLKRHRLFELSWWLMAPECECALYRARGYMVAGSYGGGSKDKHIARHVRQGGYTPATHIRGQLMGIDWMTQHGLAQAIPPAYSQWLGAALLEQVQTPREKAEADGLIPAGEQMTLPFG